MRLFGPSPIQGVQWQNIPSSMYPTQDDAFDIGKADKNWRHFFMSGNFTVDTASWVGLSGSTARIAFVNNTVDEINLVAALVQIGDGTFSWGHTPIAGGLGIEGILEVDGAAYFDSTATFADNITVTTTKWLGLGAAKGRIEFDDQATDEVNFLDCNVGIGTSAPSATSGGLDISSGALSLIVGADNVASSRTNATEKDTRIGLYHYTNTEQPVGLIHALSNATNNSINIGGGSGLVNASTDINFYTAADTTTTTGSKRVVITSAGLTQFGTSSGAGLVNITPASAIDGLLVTQANAAAAATFVGLTGNPFLKTQLSSGGLSYEAAEATAAITANHTITIQVNVPSGAKIVGAQLRVDAALATGETWNAQYVTGATQSIATSQAVAQNTKVNKRFDTNATTDIASNEVDVTIQKSSSPGIDVFSAQGTIRAIVYYQLFETMASL